ncbi:transmembrane emp24 domain-containing protein p24delta9-like [Cicer arietinum]|uniref:Transmembrane emp24 domain-containing protein p24delta9-like n=1 Tax=Cicer arietinum TaxID=3827 RepID=A0A1S2XJ31_CICAR|nr:transmembrane emp24 domain-containing protein p24delta9-like [Cicer arietinum]
MNMLEFNTRKSYLLFLVGVALGLFSYSVESMRFDLPHGKTNRCFSENVKKSSMVVGNYSIVNSNNGHPLPANHIIDVRVSTDGGRAPYHVAEGVQSGQFAFTAYQSGDYSVCFVDTNDDPQVTLSVDLEWKTGVATINYPNIVKRNLVDRMALDVIYLHKVAVSIMDEMLYLREENDQMLMLNYTTDTKMFWLSFVSFLVCFSVAGLQLWHLKTFFEKKKII